MSCPELTEKLVAAIHSGRFDAIVCNIANPDMVGHSGDLQAAILAAQAVDKAIGEVDAAVRAAGSPEVPSNEVGLAILGPLRELDEVAYLRFASVYRSFTSAADFEREIEALRTHRQDRQSGEPSLRSSSR